MIGGSGWRKLTLRFDWALAAGVAVLIGIGLVNLYSATRASQPGLYTQQLVWLALGLTAFTVAALVDYRTYHRISYAAYGLGLVALVAVLVAGHTVNGARRWFDFGPVRLQPSELMKVLLVLGLAKFLHDDPEPEGRGLKHLALPAVLAALPIALILRQPDLGTALIVFLVFLSVMLLTKLKARSVVMMLGAALAAAPLTWIYLLHEYQKKRILAFLDPSSDPSGAGWHARQSIFAVGSGRWTGKGWLKGTQNQLQFLPEHWTDFPFSVWAEEWGFAGGAVLVAVYLFLVLHTLRVAAEARDRFGTGLCLGVAALLFWHAFINIGMVTGLMPVVGVTLPLFSYGGSSLVTMLIALGLVMNVSVRRAGY